MTAFRPCAAQDVGAPRRREKSGLSTRPHCVFSESGRASFPRRGCAGPPACLLMSYPRVAGIHGSLPVSAASFPLCTRPRPVKGPFSPPGHGALRLLSVRCAAAYEPTRGSPTRRVHSAPLAASDAPCCCIPRAQAFAALFPFQRRLFRRVPSPGPQKARSPRPGAARCAFCRSGAPRRRAVRKVPAGPASPRPFLQIFSCSAMLSCATIGHNKN